jgi:hypothetical protein
MDCANQPFWTVPTPANASAATKSNKLVDLERDGVTAVT